MRAWWTAVWLVVAVACTNPFSVRSPEPPTGQLPTQSNLQTSPDSLLSKLSIAFDTRDPQFYIECFSDSGFVYMPTQAEASRLLEWSRESEEAYFRRLVFEAEDVVLTEAVLSGRQLSPEQYETEFQYEIRAEFSTKAERYQGQSILRIVQEADGLWYIHEWNDLTLSQARDSSWSTLRATYR